MNKLFECVEGNQFKMAEGEIVSETKDKVISKYPQFSNFIGKRIKRIVYKSNGEEMIFEFDDGSKLPVIKTFGEVRQIILGKEFDKRDE